MSLSIEIAATRAAIAPSGGTTHLRITVIPPANEATAASRRPVALMLVADRSGSMKEPAGPPIAEEPQPVAPPFPPAPRPIIARPFQAPAPAPMPMYGSEHRTKISVLRDAAERLVDAMRDEDLLGLVSFSDVAQRDLPLAQLGNGMRQTARQAIRALRPDASTNLADGLHLAFDQFSPETLRTHICKVLVITDGQANVGVRDADGLASIVAPAADRRITLSAIGVGLSYDAAVLGAISRAGNGEYHHIESAVGIDALLRSELDATAAVTLRGVEVLITAGGAAIGANLNGYRQSQTPQGVQVVLGDLARPREIWLELTSPVALQGDVPVTALLRGMAADDVPEEAGSTLLLRVTTDLQSVPEDAALVRELAAVIRAQGVGEAAEQYDSGNYAAGRQRAQTAQAHFAAMQSTYATAAPLAPFADLDQLAAAPAPSNSQEERRRLKELASSSNAARRGRKPDQT